jgi:DNA-binding NtrC family response regulator
MSDIKPEQSNEAKVIEKYNKVLIIDDELALVHNMQDYLENHQVGFASAENANSALVLIETDLFDVIFCDIQMPEMNGLTFLETIRHKGITTPVVFFSGFYEKDMLQVAMQLGAFDFIEKPVTEETLIKVTERATEYGLLQRKIADIRDTKDSKQKKTLNEYKNKINQLVVRKFTAAHANREEK